MLLLILLSLLDVLHRFGELLDVPTHHSLQDGLLHNLVCSDQFLGFVVHSYLELL